MRRRALCTRHDDDDDDEVQNNLTIENSIKDLSEDVVLSFLQRSEFSAVSVFACTVQVLCIKMPFE